jgi:hypothetical protein
MATGTRGGVDILFPVRGTPGGWRDRWDDDDIGEIRVRMDAADGRLAARAQELGRRWQRQIERETRERRGGSG